MQACGIGLYSCVKWHKHVEGLGKGRDEGVRICDRGIPSERIERSRATVGESGIVERIVERECGVMRDEYVHAREGTIPMSRYASRNIARFARKARGNGEDGMRRGRKSAANGSRASRLGLRPPLAVLPPVSPLRKL